MENSREEDIEILEELRTHGYAMLLMKYEDRIKTNRKIDQALEHIVSDYKRVLKENEQLRTEVNSLKKDISNMYDEEIIISIISDNFNLSRNEVLELLGGEE